MGSRLNYEVNNRVKELEQEQPERMREWHFITAAREVVREKPDLIDSNNPTDMMIAMMADRP